MVELEQNVGVHHGHVHEVEEDLGLPFFLVDRGQVVARQLVVTVGAAHDLVVLGDDGGARHGHGRVGAGGVGEVSGHGVGKHGESVEHVHRLAVLPAGKIDVLRLCQVRTAHLHSGAEGVHEAARLLALAGLGDDAFRRDICLVGADRADRVDASLQQLLGQIDGGVPVVRGA